MIPKSKQEFQMLHNELLQNYTKMKFNISLTIQQCSKILEGIHNETGHDVFFKEYCAYITALFNMLAKTTEYVFEMMSNIRIENNVFNYDGSFPFTRLESDNSSINTSLSSCTDTLVGTECNSCYTAESNLNILPSDTLRHQSNIHPPDGTNPFKTNADANIFKRPKVPCGTMDTSIFKVGAIIPSASICSKDPNGQSFCIFINDGPESEFLTLLYNKKSCPNYTYLPDKDVVFGMKVEDGIVRAVRCLPLSTKKAYLPDFGDIVDIEESLSNIYHLSEEEQSIPGQAVHCQLYKSSSLINGTNEKSPIIELPLYERMSFVVHNILNGVLYLSPLRYNSTQNAKTDNIKQSGTQITSEEWELLDEEPLSTTNALKAVLGYVPKDEKRICPHYDPKTDSCFKGSNCRREHTQMPTGYFTKDKEPANAFADKPSMPSIIYASNEVLEVLVTHVKSLEYFFGIIIDPGKPPQEPLLWHDSDIPESDHLKVLPAHYDIILAKFNDGNWYRAEVIEIYENSKEVFVFYLDYGNRQLVNLKETAKCPTLFAGFPAQAQLFRLANYHAITTQKYEIIKRGLSQLSNLLNDQYIKVCVVSHHEDLVVRLLEEPYCDIPKMLEDMHCVKMVDMY